MSPLTLYELNAHVRTAVESSLDSPLWLQAELSSVSERGMHCYLEFVQKVPDGSGALLAKARGQIWARTWSMLRPHFERTTRQSLSAGMKVLVEVEVTFHELYGYSLNVIDIDPAYTLGDLARRRQEILLQLQQAGVADMNKTLQLPLLLQRIAVISSESAAGWGDFRSQLIDNPHHLAFRLRLFPAIMQGERVETTIIEALNQIFAHIDQWDAVVIIRGGGATSDLSGFDSLSLAEHVAQFPLPIITGIGHERDDTVIDLVSHTRVKTPTAAAELILHHQLRQLDHLASLAANIGRHATTLMHTRRMQLLHIVATLPAVTTKYIEMEHLRLRTTESTLQQQLATRIERERHRLQLMDATLRSADPDHILCLGYSIVRKEGMAVTKADAIQAGDTIHITFHEGSITTTV
mgnify:CR=1 FL=1